MTIIIIIIIIVIIIIIIIKNAQILNVLHLFQIWVLVIL